MLKKLQLQNTLDALVIIELNGGKRFNGTFVLHGIKKFIMLNLSIII